MTTTPGFDATSSNISALPAGQHAGYVTGTPDIAWTAAQYSADPGAIRICQSFGATVATADVLDVESGAATPQDCPGWVTRARATFAAGTRPGQRHPMIYCSESSLQPIINELEAAKIFNVPFWMARPGTPIATAEQQVNTATGNYPCGGVQYGWHPAYDSNVWNSAWLTQQSGLPLVSTVSVGNSGPAVVGLQELLNGLPAGAGLPVDGLFGTGTLAAAITFQKKAGLAQDGIVGPLTWAALVAAQVIPVPVPVPPTPDPKTYAAPTGLADRVLSTGSLVTFSWGAVPGATAYTLQVEILKGSTWVLTTNQSVAGTSQAVSVPPRSNCRWRVAVSASGHAWPAWVSFKTT